MSFLLDTCAISELSKTTPVSGFVEWLDSCDEDMLNICSVTLGELRYGIDLLSDGKRKMRLLTWFEMIRASYVGHIIDVSQDAFLRWGMLRAECKKAGRPLPMADGLIASVAIVEGLTVVTRNTCDFDGLGVELINPWNEMG